MIAIDTSSLVAIVLGEDDAERHLEVLRRSAARLSTVTMVEATIVVEARQGPDAGRDLQLLIDGAVQEIVPVDEWPPELVRRGDALSWQAELPAKRRSDPQSDRTSWRRPG